MRHDGFTPPRRSNKSSPTRSLLKASKRGDLDEITSGLEVDVKSDKLPIAIYLDFSSSPSRLVPPSLRFEMIKVVPCL